MKHTLQTPLLAIALLSTPYLAEAQFDKLHQIEQQQKRDAAAAEAEQRRQLAAEKARKEAREDALRRQRAAAEQKAREQQLALSKEKEEEARRLQKRDESFEDELRALELEERKLILQAKKARVTRADEFIDAELREQAAKTDVIQSEADSARDLSSGTKAFLEGHGEAEVNRSKRLFGD
ncbi:hypothetical protein C7H85_08450 [Zobellella endophytica]|uniref:DUF5384 family protein n=1 Tax=Zobellella endophytica TaxID=2116700 RepID=A0A2P7R9B5_9GAMM|nr:DUF5384 family protein [Zobellella endophytica]PSJ46801.1 hypothetical protein C7H85_08450 [Zobellella endophytica]